jgi:hypothetical protein
MKHAIAVAAFVLASAGVASAQNVKLEIKNGLVNLSAQSAPVPQILAAWATVGRTKIVNGEKVAATLLTLELNGVPEKTALQTLLRSVSGYMAVVRAVPDASASVYDRIWVLPTPAAPITAGFTPPSSVPPGPQQFPVYPNVPIAGGPGLEGAVPVNIDDPNNFLNRPMPVPVVPFQGGIGNPMVPAPGSTFTIGGTTMTQPPNNTNMPVGAAVPGMIIAPPPQQPGQGPPTIVYPSTPPQPGQPIRR